MVRVLLRRRKFEDVRFLGKYWLLIFDATGLFHFPERHCPHCLKKVVNRGTTEEKEIYYHHMLEAKLVLGDGLVISIGTEFIENEAEDVSKNDCETKAFKRLSEWIKKEYSRLSVCVLADSLYASEPVFQRCKQENKWHVLICYKEGSIPSIEEYRSIADMGDVEEVERQIAREYPRKGQVKEKHHMEWVPEIDCRGYKLTLLVLEIETESERTGKKEAEIFQWLTNLVVKGKNAGEFASAGRWEVADRKRRVQPPEKYPV